MSVSTQPTFHCCLYPQHWVIYVKAPTVGYLDAGPNVGHIVADPNDGSAICMISAQFFVRIFYILYGFVSIFVRIWL